MLPVISVGIPTYNQAQMLKQAIQSVLQQTFQAFEIIVFDDCSTDATATVVAEFNDPRLHYYRATQNLRPPRSWNACVRLAQGEFFCLLPHDDVYQPAFLETLVTSLRNNPDIAMAQCGYTLVNHNLQMIKSVVVKPPALKLRGDRATIWQLQNQLCVPVSLMFRLSAMHRIGLWNEIYWDDIAFIVKLAHHLGFVYIPHSLSAVRLHINNLNRVLWQKEKRDIFLDIMYQHTDIFGDILPLSEEMLAFRAQLNRDLSAHYILRMLGALRSGAWHTMLSHWHHAHQLYALAGLDLHFLSLWWRIRQDTLLMQKQQKEALGREPLQFVSRS